MAGPQQRVRPDRQSPATFDRSWKRSRAPRRRGPSPSFRKSRSRPPRCGRRLASVLSWKTSAERQNRPPPIHRGTEVRALNRAWTRLKRDEVWMNRHRAFGLCLSMMFSESRCTLFRIMLQTAGGNQAGCSSALRTRSAVLRAPSLRMASARWLSNVLGLMFIRKAPCLLEHPSLIRLSTSRSRLVSGF